MNIFKKIQGGIYGGIGFVLVLGITSIAYGAYVSITDVESGDILTIDLFNKVLENQRTLESTIENIPAGFIGSFNLSTCPTGWIAANGSNGTPDLRGEFVRGLDSGRGVDTGRGLGSLQRGSLIMNPFANTEARIFNLSHSGDGRLGFDRAMTDPSKPYYRNQLAGGTLATWTTNGAVDTGYVKMTRPRNVALLYCMKQ